MMMKPIADRLAELLADDRGSTTLGLLRLMRLYGNNVHIKSSDSAVAASRTRVGIWEAQGVEESVHYVRANNARDSELWADVESIAPKRGTKRVVLVGESVARGYLYDPCFNPASALKDILQNACDGPEINIVDLARSDLLIDGLQQIIEESLVLDPDAIVVFAGNNWSAQTFEMIAPAISEMLGEGCDLAAISRLIVRQIRGLTESFIQWLGKFSKQVSIPVIVIVPEFNLVDWRPSALPPAPFLPSGCNAQWFHVRDEAERALAAREFGRASDLGAELRALDGGITMAGASIEAMTKLCAGPTPAARTLLESVRDAEIWRPVQSTPRCFATTQDALRRTVPAAGLKLLDLPGRFEEYSGGLPDRRLFLDYCHLTSEGINVAMASAADLLLPALGVCSDRTWRDLARTARGPSPEVEGHAHLLSAIHCAKLGQAFDFVRHHCAEAVKASPTLVGAIECCLDFQTRKAPNLLCPSFEHLIHSGAPSSARYLLTHGCEDKESHKALRRVFTKAALSVLDPIDPGIGRRIRALTLEIHGVTCGGVNLLQRAYSQEGVCSESQSADFHKSNQIESHFTLFCHAQNPLELRFTCRLPEGDGDVSICMNGVVLSIVRATDQWTTFRIPVRLGLTMEGPNALEVRWPVPATLGEGGLVRMRASLELGSVPEMSPVLGEVHSFVAITTGAAA
jgi:hypothetical protein